MRIIAESLLDVVVRVDAGDGPVVLVPRAETDTVLNLAQAVLDTWELEELSTFLLRGDEPVGVP